MTRGGPRALVLALLFVLPAVAHAPAWREERLLGPGDGTFLHYPMRAAAWSELKRGHLPGWNSAIFGGTPLLAHYRAGTFYPLMPALCPLRPFVAFQLLVLLSLGAAGVVTFLYLQRLGAHGVGAFVGGLAFALGPYLVNHLGDTATVVAAPLLPLVLLAAEAHAGKAGALRAAGLSLALALLLLAGSPVAVRAGIALVLGRLLLLHTRRRPDQPSLRSSGLALLAGVLLAAPQLLPTLLALREAGRGATGIAGEPGRFLPGLTGLVLQYVSHTPAPVLALAALPLAFTRRSVRAFLVALLLCLALRFGRGPLSAPGSLALAFDFTLALLAGLCLSAHWESRQDASGRRLRAYMLFAGLAAAVALSVAAATLGPLPQRLAGAVGVLALGFILLMSATDRRDPVVAGAFLLPLTASLLLQPLGREVWAGAPTRRELAFGTPAHEAVDRALGPRKGERLLTVAREWPAAALDLGFGNLASVHARASLHGYDPLVPRRTRYAFGGMSAAGLLPVGFFRTPPGWLERLGVRFVQAPADALAVGADAQGLGDRVDLPLVVGRPRLLPVRSEYATELRLASWMADAVGLGNGQVVAQVAVRLASGRDLEYPLRVGRETGEWAYDRADVRPLVRHARPPLLTSFRDPGTDFDGHRYLAVLRLGGRYRVTGLRLERRPGQGRLYLHAAGLSDGPSHHGLSMVSAWLSDVAVLREVPAAPTLRLFAVRGGLGPARVVSGVRLVPTEEEIRRRLVGDDGFDPRQEGLMTASEMARAELRLAGARGGRAAVVHAEGDRLELRAEGPGLLVLATSFDPGWRAQVGDAPAPVLLVNAVQMGVPLGPGPQRVTLRYDPPGLKTGLGLAVAGAGALALALLRERRTAPVLS